MFGFFRVLCGLSVSVSVFFNYVTTVGVGGGYGFFFLKQSGPPVVILLVVTGKNYW